MANEIKFEKGMRIYWTGDMANDEGFGTIEVVYENRWGKFVDIAFDDGRFTQGISQHMFSPEYLGHGGTRWVTADAYKAWRREKMAQLTASLSK